MVGDYFLYCMCQSFTTVERQPFNKRFTFHNLNIVSSFLHREIGGGWAAGVDFPGGLVAKNLPSNARETGLIPGWETKRPHATGQLSPCAETEDPACCN